MTGRQPRPRPCASCPYRRDVPAGVWDACEYAKLRRYDGDTAQQSPATFLCHQADGHVCSGWLGHGDPAQLLAVRLGVMAGHLDPACFDYRTRVPLFTSGREAAEHGLSGITRPDDRAQQTIAKITRRRTVGVPGEDATSTEGL